MIESVAERLITGASGELAFKVILIVGPAGTGGITPWTETTLTGKTVFVLVFCVVVGFTEVAKAVAFGVTGSFSLFDCKHPLMINTIPRTTNVILLSVMSSLRCFGCLSKLG